MQNYHLQKLINWVEIVASLQIGFIFIIDWSVIYSRECSMNYSVFRKALR